MRNVISIFPRLLYVGSAVSKRNRRNNFASTGKENRGYTKRNGLQWNIEENEITCELFAHFKRHQVVTKCWRKIDGEWCIKDIAFVEEWTEECLKNTGTTGGMVAGAFDDGKLK